METKGGNLYDSPEVQILKNAHQLELSPINLETLFANNEELLFYLEYEAIHFFVSTFSKYSG